MSVKKLLVADDSLTIQKVIRLALANEGYEIQAISDGNDAVQHISLFQPDLVLIDVSLPGKSAFEVKRLVNQEPDLTNIRFILMSSAFERVDENQATEVGFHGRLTKPFDPGHLREILGEVMVKFPPKLKSATANAPGLQSVPSSPPSRVPERPAMYSSTPPPQYTSPLEGLPPFEPAPFDSDIKELTENTIRMSGLSDFEWSVQEPNLKPPTHMDSDGEFNTGNLNFFKVPIPVDEAGEAAQKKQAHEELSFQNPAYNPTGSAIDLDLSLPPLPTPPPAPSMRHAPPHAPTESLDSQRNIDALVAKKVEEALGKMVQKMLPEMAEKIIKEQIRNLLSEQ